MSEQKLTLAERYHEGELAKDRIEDALCDLLPWEDFGIGQDHYDNSLEIYLKGNGPDEWRATPELTESIKGMGFSQYWVNWPDGTEQHCTGTRKPRAQPVARSSC